MLLFQVKKKFSDILQDKEMLAAKAAPEEYVKTLKNSAIPLTREELARQLLLVSSNAKCLLVGESHTVEWHRTLLAEMMPKLKQAGFGSLGLEFFPKEMQIELDRENDKPAEEYLKSNFKWDAPRTAESILGLMKNAREN